MDTLLRVALSNAVIAAALAVVAAATGRLCRRPALTHGLWLLVLLKLLTPPLITLPAWPAAVPPEAQAALTPRVEPVDLLVPPEQSLPSPPVTSLPPVEVQPPPPSPTIAERPSETTEDLSAALDWTAGTAGLVLLWVGGTVAWSLLAVRRVNGFRRLLRFAEAAPGWLRAEVAELAGRLGLRRVPAVCLVPGRLPPMVWALGGAPRLLLPAGLLESLTGEQRAALLLHELAHLRRRDHWVRALEMLTMGLFWWHPVVWWARRELREAEEQCCDAWVVWALPGAGRTYATALLECLDFLSDVPVPLPLGASGLGRTADLKRRLTMILRGNTPRRLSWSGSLALLVLGVLMLPAAFGQDRNRTTRDPESRPDDRREQNKLGDKQEIDRMRAEVAKLKRELDAQVRALDATKARLRQAAELLNRLEGRGPRNTRPVEEPRRPRFTPPRTEEPRTETRPPVPVPPSRIPAVIETRPGTGREWGRTRPEGDRRIQELERKLDDVLRQLDELKRSLRGVRPERNRTAPPENSYRRPAETRPVPRAPER
jgi:beta-lactamase regulating signal transducer with metallopeptidase domain